MKKINFILILLFFDTFVFGQLVNIENLKRSTKAGWQGTVSASYLYTENTRTISTLKAYSGIQYTYLQNTYLFFASFSTLKIDTLPNILNGGYEHFRYSHSLSGKRVSFEGFVQHQFNSIKYLKRRIISGGGVRYKMIKKDNFNLSVAPLLMFEHEEYDDDFNSETNYLKGDIILIFNAKINTMISVNHVTYYQPRLSDWTDFRVSTETMLNIKLIKNLNIGISFSLSYDSQPPIKDKVPINSLFFSSGNTLIYSF